MAKWEYKTTEWWHSPLSDEFLNKEGSEGWELVAIIVERGSYLYTFKRQTENYDE